MAQPIIIGERGNEAIRSSRMTMDTKEGAWHGQTLETPKERIVDTAKGKAGVIRRFDFNLPPMPKGSALPTDKELLDYNKGRVLALVWKDGLEQIGDMRIVKTDKGFSILVPALVRDTQVILHKPKNLNNIINGNKN